eukprot:scaffold62503_cov18-Tisochrysis_lutea.AAC.1
MSEQARLSKHSVALSADHDRHGSWQAEAGIMAGIIALNRGWDNGRDHGRTTRRPAAQYPGQSGRG